MVTWIPSIYPSHVSIYTSTVHPMAYGICYMAQNIRTYFQTPRILKAGVFDEKNVCGQYFLDERGKRTNEYLNKY